MPPNSPRESIPDLLKSSDAYREHLPSIDHVRHMIGSRRTLVRDAIAQVNRVRGRSTTWLPSPDAIDREAHINCEGLQILAHNMGMVVFDREQDDKELAGLREPLRYIAAVRLSLMQFEAMKATRAGAGQYESQKVVPHLAGVIADLDDRVPAIAPTAPVPSLTPYLFKPQTAISQLRTLAGSQKFRDPEILMNMGSLYPNDHHILRSVCMGLLSNGMHAEVKTVLENRAEELFGTKLALGVFLKQNLELFSVFFISMVEGGQFADAEKWGNMVGFAQLRCTDKKIAEKYVTALRCQGKFDDAMRFMETLRDEYKMSTPNLHAQYGMARCKDRSIMITSEGRQDW